MGKKAKWIFRDTVADEMVRRRLNPEAEVFDLMELIHETRPSDFADLLQAIRERAG